MIKSVYQPVSSDDSLDFKNVDLGTDQSTATGRPEEEEENEKKRKGNKKL